MWKQEEVKKVPGSLPCYDLGSLLFTNSDSRKVWAVGNCHPALMFADWQHKLTQQASMDKYTKYERSFFHTHSLVLPYFMLATSKNIWLSNYSFLVYLKPGTQKVERLINSSGFRGNRIKLMNITNNWAEAKSLLFLTLTEGGDSLALVSSTDWCGCCKMKLKNLRWKKFQLGLDHIVWSLACTLLGWTLKH